MPTTRSSGGRRKEPTLRVEPPTKRQRKAPVRARKAEKKENGQTNGDAHEEEAEEEEEKEESKTEENGVAAEEVEEKEEEEQKDEEPIEEEEPAKEEEETKEKENNEEAATEEEEKVAEEPKEEEAPKEETVPEEKENEPEAPAEVEPEAPPAPAPTKGRRGRKPKKVSVEHCVFKRNAVQVTDSIRSMFPDIEVELNPKKPRSKTFECSLFQITVIFEDGESVLVWSGLKKGPPRRLKFPEASNVLTSIEELL
ncbi:Selenoprotein H [Portunus trituberculatus]|uniref:Selenoprotein H n=1 Tax=Portunus trituberculatus TaxID=210409 RepID=A0A5B7E7G2_PORTR|nr:Selenoprotein H [Portunus trituberculatus]